MKYKFVLRLSALLLFFAALSAADLSNAQPLSICVTEFENLSGSAEDAWLGPFIADSIENNLKVFPDIKLVHEKRPRDSTEGSVAADAAALRSSLCAMARAANAQFIASGDFQSDGRNFSVVLYFFEVSEEKQIEGASFVSSVPELYSRLDDLSVSLAGAVGLIYSDEQFARICMVPTTSHEAMAYYGEALAVPPASKERESLLLKAISEDPGYTDALAKLGIYYYETERLAKAQEAFERLAGIQADYSHVYYNLGLTCRARRHYFKATKMYRKALDIEPRDSDVWNNLGAVYWLMGMHEEAVDAFGRAIEVNPNASNARMNLEIISATRAEGSVKEPRFVSAADMLREHIEAGAAFYATGDYWHAVEKFGRALDIQPDNFKANNNIALAYLKIGDTEKARKHFERALEADPSAIDVSENLARLQSVSGPSEVVAQMDAASQPPDQSDALRAAGKVYLSRRAYEKAVDAFSRALAESPDDVEALNGLGTAYFALGKYAKAWEQFEKTLSLEPENETANKKLEDIEFVLAAAQEKPEGKQAVRLAIPSGVEARARFTRANELYEAENYEEAVSEYLRALDLAPASVETLNNLGTTYFILHRYEEAEAFLKKAHELDPDNELVRENLDVLAMANRADKPAEMKKIEVTPIVSATEMGKKEKPHPLMSSSTGVEAESPENARPSVEKHSAGRQEEAQQTNTDAALEVSPDSARAHFNIGVLKEEEGDLEAALRHYREAVRLEPGNVNAQYNLGNTYFRLGAFESAIDCYLAAVEADPLFARGYNNVAVAYYRLGRYREATAGWLRALEADPTLESARENLRSFGVEHVDQTEVPAE